MIASIGCPVTNGFPILTWPAIAGIGSRPSRSISYGIYYEIWFIRICSPPLWTFFRPCYVPAYRKFSFSGIIMAKSLSLFRRCNNFRYNFENPLDNLREVLGRFAKYDFKLKPKKCHLFKKSIEFLGQCC